MKIMKNKNYNKIISRINYQPNTKNLKANIRIY